jgi:hypothetical protein
MRLSISPNKGARLVLITAAIILLGATAFASKTFQPVYEPTLTTMKTVRTINIDGDVSISEWQTAGRAANFVERYPGDMTQPAVETRAFITYDDDNLYVAFVCHDDPNTIRATMCQRDQFGSDDAVCLLIDTFGDAARAYEFFVNPYGIQKDRLWSSIAGADQGFDLIWTSAAQITDSGYQVEMAIPFASLRFPNKDVQTWKMDFWRNRPRDSFLQYSWAAYDRDEQCWPCQWGTVDGIRDVQPSKGLEILPAFVANQSGTQPSRLDPDSKFDDGDVMGEPSMGVKYSFTSDIILDAAFNPDFSQIEADAQQIDVNSPMALFYPERRPFFQEGRDIFRTLFNSFYTRTVNDPDFAAKLTARMDRTTLAFISARDDISPYVIPLEEGDITINGNKSTVNALRGLRTIGDDTQVGFIVTDRRFDGGGSGTILALDGDIRLSRSFSIDGQFVLSHTQEADDHSRSSFFEGSVPAGWEDSVTAILGGMTFDDNKRTVVFDGESFYGGAFISRLRRHARNWNFTVDYNQVNPSYRTQTGYDPYMNYRNFSIYSSYNFYPRNSVFERITPQIYSLGRWNFSGLRKLRIFNASVEANLKFAQTGFNISHGRKEEIYAGTRYDNLWSVNVNINSRLSNQLGYSVGMGLGRDIAYFQQMKGDELSLYASLNLKPIDRLMIEPTLNFIRSDDIESGDQLFRQLVVRSRFRLQVNRELSVRLVVQYNRFNYTLFDGEGNRSASKSQRWDVDPLLTYRLGSFTVFYIGSTNDYRRVNQMLDDKARWRLTDRQFFMKIQYLFQT